MSDVQRALDAMLVACWKGNYPIAQTQAATIRDHIASLTAELGALRRDAERYRWLCEGENASVRLLHLPPSGVGWPKTLDEAIDAARQQEADRGHAG